VRDEKEPGVEAPALPKPDADAARLLGWGWAARRLGHRIVAAGLDPVAFGFPSDARTLGFVPALASVVAETVVWLIVFASGLVALLVLSRRERSWSRIGDAITVAPWTGRAAWAALVRGLALGLGLTLVWQLGWEALGGTGFAPGGTVLGMLPVVVLARRRLLVPSGLSWSRTLAIPARSGSELRLLLLTAAALTVDLLGGHVIARIAHAAGARLEWTEVMLEPLLTGSIAYRLVIAVEAVVLAPVVEEMLARGLLYPTLRRSWSPLAAATISGALFSLAHGYGIAGFAALLWGGIVLAVAYERSGTLLVPILVHVINNLSVSISHVRLW
jgi:hypothetical protein